MRKYFCVYIVMAFILSAPTHAASHHPQDFLTQIRGTKNEGMQIYRHFCVNCHAQKPLIPLGAPRIGHEEDWKLRLKQGLNVLISHTDEGLNAMPPRGGCFECTDQQLLLAIIAMLPLTAQKTLINELKAHKKNTK